MENQRNLLFIGLLSVSVVLYLKWLEFSKPQEQQPAAVTVSQSTPVVPTQDVANDLPSVPAVSAASIPNVAADQGTNTGQIVRVETDLVIAEINSVGGVIQRLELKEEPASPETPDQGFVMLMNEADEQYAIEVGLQTSSGEGVTHKTEYQVTQTSYDLGQEASVSIPLVYISPEGIKFTKTITFKRDSYVVDIDYTINNVTGQPWQGFLYGQFKRTEPANSGGGFGQLPAYTGGVYFTEEDKYTKVDFGDIQDGDALPQSVDKTWVAMLQHYFVGVFIPQDGPKNLYGLAGREANPVYRFGYLDLTPTVAQPGQQATASTQVFIGPKNQNRLKALEDKGFTAILRTVDYGWLTFIADPLFKLLRFIHSMVGNWGWAIILLTVLIKAAFYPLSDKSGKSMAAMKKIQPRLQTLKERYKDDKQKFQMEMMELYKKEKINPAAGCLPILIQMPVFLALYWVLLESVELRQAPFAMWLQDLSAPDPYYILPVLMGVTQFIMFKLNPTPMDDIQKKVFMIMPIVFIFIFATFPQGLVLYWVVNNILSMAQQWYINRKYAV